MKWRCFLFLMFILSFTFLINTIKAQSRPYQVLPAKTTVADTIGQVMGRFTDSLLTIYDNINLRSGKKIMTREYFDMFFTKYFSYLSTTKEGLPNGNAVSLEPTSNSTRIQANLSHKRTYTIYNLGIKADFSDNIANVFAAKDATANTSFYANVSFLNTGSRLINYDLNLAGNYNDKKIFKIQEYKADLELRYRISYSKDSVSYETIRHQLDSITKFHTGTPTDSNIVKTVRLRQELTTAMAKLKAYGLNERSELYCVNGIMDNITKQLKDSLKVILDTMEVNNDSWNSFRFSWFSAGLTYTRQQYKIYDSTRLFSERSGDLPFNNTGLTIGYNFIHQRNDRYLKTMKHRLIKSFYLNAAYTLANDLNYSHTDPQDLLMIKESRRGDTDTIYQLQTSAKVRDISGQAKTVDWLNTFGVQGTAILAKGNFMGVTMGVNSSYSRFVSPVYGGRLGLLFRFINGTDQKSKVNFEVFLQLNDWNDSKGSSKSTWQRKSIGFNATIPFSKLFF